MTDTKMVPKMQKTPLWLEVGLHRVNLWAGSSHQATGSHLWRLSPDLPATYRGQLLLRKEVSFAAKAVLVLAICSMCAAGVCGGRNLAEE